MIFVFFKKVKNFFREYWQTRSNFDFDYDEFDKKKHNVKKRERKKKSDSDQKMNKSKSKISSKSFTLFSLCSKIITFTQKSQNRKKTRRYFGQKSPKNRPSPTVFFVANEVLKSPTWRQIAISGHTALNHCLVDSVTRSLKPKIADSK